MNSNDIVKATRLITHAHGLLITAGAGMGVDSGLPDFRGKNGFWQAYPALRQGGVDFQSMASPVSFWATPRQAWGFYGHRLNQYRHTEPHAGFGVLRRIGDQLAGGAFVYTSNVDGQFQKSGFPEQRVAECHGSIHYMQCLDDCRHRIWSADGFEPIVNEDRCCLVNNLPACPHCGLVARPNILMFNDREWMPDRSSRQRQKLREWLAQYRRIVVIEIGAGTVISTVRDFGLSQSMPLIRINPHDADVRPSRQRVSLRMNALPALLAIEQDLTRAGFFDTLM